jgi:integrase
MSIKGKNNKSSIFSWNELLNLLTKLKGDNEYMIMMFIALGAFTGLKSHEILKLKWSDLMGTDKKVKDSLLTSDSMNNDIYLNDNLKIIIVYLFECMNVGNVENYIFLNQKQNKVISLQYINRKLKQIKTQYKINIENFSTETIRKTFGRNIWELNNRSVLSLSMVSKRYNHPCISVTKKYLQIEEDNNLNIYATLKL